MITFFGNLFLLILTLIIVSANGPTGPSSNSDVDSCQCIIGLSCSLWPLYQSSREGMGALAMQPISFPEHLSFKLSTKANIQLSLKIKKFKSFDPSRNAGFSE